MKCLVCGEEEVENMPWSDYYGQCYCPKCGMSYRRLPLKDGREDVPFCDKEDLVTLVKYYYGLTSKSAGLGTYISGGQEDYQYPIAEAREFSKWVSNNLNYLMKEFPNVSWSDDARGRTCPP